MKHLAKKQAGLAKGLGQGGLGLRRQTTDPTGTASQTCGGRVTGPGYRPLVAAMRDPEPEPDGDLQLSDTKVEPGRKPRWIWYRVGCMRRTRPKPVPGRGVGTGQGACNRVAALRRAGSGGGCWARLRCQSWGLRGYWQDDEWMQTEAPEVKSSSIRSRVSSSSDPDFQAAINSLSLSDQTIFHLAFDQSLSSL